MGSLASLLAVFVANFLISFFDAQYSNSWGIETILLVSAAITFAATVVLLLWGLPIHWLLRKYDKQRFRFYLLAGFLPPFVLVFALKPFGNDSIEFLFRQSAYLGLLGVIAVIVFWFISVRGTGRNLETKMEVDDE